MKNKIIKKADTSEEDMIFPLPVYKAEDDIYNREKKEPLEDEENSKKYALGFKDQDPGLSLDVPGSELDDANEAIGEEDEENNYYSLSDEDNATETNSQ